MGLEFLTNKVNLASLPTPLNRLNEVSKIHKSEIWIKRDDMTGSQLSGNKIRKLEYLLKHAIDNGHRMIITAGSEQSNHCRTTALAAKQLGLECHLVLSHTGEGPSGNLLLDILSGASFKWITSSEFCDIDDIMCSEAEKFKSMNPYILPAGGSNPIGIAGYIAAAREIASQCQAIGKYPENIAVAVGTAGTFAGLALGMAIEKMDTSIIGISSGFTNDQYEEQTYNLMALTSDYFDLNMDIDSIPINISDDYIADGYGILDCDTAEFVIRFAQQNGIILDTTYTAKAFMGALEEFPPLKRENGINIILHTGGIFGLFTKGQVFRELYAAMQTMV